MPSGLCQGGLGFLVDLSDLTKSHGLTHRVAVANSRLISMADDRVAFRWRDYRHRGTTKVVMLEAQDFIRRFLLHTPRDAFHRIRHYGFLTCHRAMNIP
uniref:transposase n=1 Tax=Mesorhizobium neociceri TaxID=1307853 RepID=UPI0038B24E00